jgi:hypothetical protein
MAERTQPITSLSPAPIVTLIRVPILLVSIQCRNKWSRCFTFGAKIGTRIFAGLALRWLDFPRRLAPRLRCSASTILNWRRSDNRLWQKTSHSSKRVSPKKDQNLCRQFDKHFAPPRALRAANGVRCFEPAIKGQMEVRTGSLDAQVGDWNWIRTEHALTRSNTAEVHYSSNSPDFVYSVDCHPRGTISCVRGQTRTSTSGTANCLGSCRNRGLPYVGARRQPAQDPTGTDSRS